MAGKCLRLMKTNQIDCDKHGEGVQWMHNCRNQFPFRRRSPGYASITVLWPRRRPCVRDELVPLERRKRLMNAIRLDDQHLQAITNFNMSLRRAGEGVFDQGDDVVF